MIDRQAVKQYIKLHVGLGIAILLFPLYVWIMEHLSLPLFNGRCVFHDYLFLYCAFCGGTRSMSALLRFDFVSAFQYNALVPILVLLAIALDVVALIRLLRGEEKLLPQPQRSWIVMVVVLIGYAVLRNYLMITEGYDPIGDLGVFWH